MGEEEFMTALRLLAKSEAEGRGSEGSNRSPGRRNDVPYNS